MIRDRSGNGYHGTLYGKTAVEPKQNLITWSEEFGVMPRSSNPLFYTIISNNILAPDNTMSADTRIGT